LNKTKFPIRVDKQERKDAEKESVKTGGCCKTVLWGRNLFEKWFSSPPCPAIASATAEPHFPKTFTGIAFITSNKSNSNLFYIKKQGICNLL